jgi:transposase-like protein
MRVWLGDTAATSSDGAGGLAALSDLGTVRNLLELIELAAVRAARRDGRSWTEIATRLGISRQSAWERWRDVDDSRPGPPGPFGSTEAVAAVPADAAAEQISEQAGWRRRRGSVRVPNVVGLPVTEAVRVVTESGLLPIGPDPDAPDPIVMAKPGSVVIDQSPESGAKVAPRSWIRLWISGDDGDGVREPRNPSPDPQRLTATLDLPAAEGIA